MDCNKDDAAKAKELAEKKFQEKDIISARKFALKAQKLFPSLDGIQDLLATLNIYVSFERKINGEVDWYRVLGVEPSSDKDTVRKHYRKLALILHPDKNKSVGAEGAFKIVSEAWTVLSDNVKRGAYDQKTRSFTTPSNCSKLHRQSYVAKQMPYQQPYMAKQMPHQQSNPQAHCSVYVQMPHQQSKPQAHGSVYVQMPHRQSCVAKQIPHQQSNPQAHCSVYVQVPHQQSNPQTHTAHCSVYVPVEKGRMFRGPEGNPGVGFKHLRHIINKIYYFWGQIIKTLGIAQTRNT